MRYWRYFWLAVSNLIAICIAITVLSVTVTRFEKAALAVLILMYAYLRNSELGMGLQFVAVQQKQDQQFIYLRKLQNDGLTEMEKEIIENEEKMSSELRIRIRINVAGIYVLFALGVFGLIAAVITS